MPARYCSNCGTARVEGASFCHQCGASFISTPRPNEQNQKDHFKTGTLLIKIGAVLAATLPFLSLLGVSAISGGAIFGATSTVAFGAIFVVMVAIGILFAAVAFKFQQDVARGNRSRIVHTLILAVVMFFLGSNVAGIVVGIGAFLCYTSPRRVESSTSSR